MGCLTSGLQIELMYGYILIPLYLFLKKDIFGVQLNIHSSCFLLVSLKELFLVDSSLNILQWIHLFTS